MIEFGVSLIEFILATFVPLYVGMFFLVCVSNATKVQTRYLSAYALGLLFWFFFDTLNDAVQLDVNQGYTFDFDHVVLLSLFILGFIVFTLVGGALSSKPEDASGGSHTSFLLTMVVALGMGMHGVGEGIEFGGLAAGTQASSVLDAIGGFGGGVAYVMHKFLEATIVIVVFVALARANDVPFRTQLWQTAVVGLTFGIPSAVGEVVGYSTTIDSAWFYALGAGAALFVVLQAIRPIFEKSDGNTYREYVRLSIAMILGFLLLYGAALLHS